MPYQPEPTRTPRVKPRRQGNGIIVAVAAILCVLLALFNLYVSLPAGVPPEFPLFLSLAAIFGALWWHIRK